MSPSPAVRRPASTRLAVRAASAAALVVLGAGLLGLASCGGGTTEDAAPATGLVVRDVRVEEPVNGRTAAVRMVLDNGGGPSDRLVAVSSDAATSATLHRSTTDELDRSAMVEVPSVEVPAGEVVRFEAGGLHVMLKGFRRPLEVGDVVDLTLTFQHGGTQTVDATVVPLGEGSDPEHDMEDMGHDHGG